MEQRKHSPTTQQRQTCVPCVTQHMFPPLNFSVFCNSHPEPSSVDLNQAEVASYKQYVVTVCKPEKKTLFFFNWRLIVFCFYENFVFVVRFVYIRLFHCAVLHITVQYGIFILFCLVAWTVTLLPVLIFILNLSSLITYLVTYSIGSQPVVRVSRPPGYTCWVAQGYTRRKNL